MRLNASRSTSQQIPSQGEENGVGKRFRTGAVAEDSFMERNERARRDDAQSNGTAFRRQKMQLERNGAYVCLDRDACHQRMPGVYAAVIVKALEEMSNETGVEVWTLPLLKGLGSIQTNRGGRCIEPYE